MNSELLLCTDCRKYAGCKEVCVYVEQGLPALDSKDFCLSELNDRTIIQDYKKIITEIAEGQQWRRRINIDNIRTIKNIRLRAIAGMLYGEISVRQISELLNISASQIYRIACKDSQQRICFMLVELELPALILNT
ncbi:MAG: hypothetical protein HQK96_06145 [Nitrospirae bacterium]|nr:hypothetical protein [Nitrospirota bacterium]